MGFGGGGSFILRNHSVKPSRISGVVTFQQIQHSNGTCTCWSKMCLLLERIGVFHYISGWTYPQILPDIWILCDVSVRIPGNSLWPFFLGWWSDPFKGYVTSNQGIKLRGIYIYTYLYIFVYVQIYTGWAPTSYKWSYNSCKWPCKWVTGVITLLIGAPFHLIYKE